MNFLFYRVFTRENATCFLRKSSSPFSLQELRPLTPLKAIDRFTSLTVIGMMKIMCNNGRPDMKSIAMDYHGSSGVGRGVYMPCFLVVDLEIEHAVQDLIYLLTSCRSLG
jgi:hypothetical protein